MKNVIQVAGPALALVVLAGCGGGSDGTAIPTLTIGHVSHDHQIALGAAALQPQLMKDRCGFHLEELKPRDVYRLRRGDTPLAELLIKKVGGGSRMPAAMSSPARYHSTIVNSGLCNGPCSPRRNTRATW